MPGTVPFDDLPIADLTVESVYPAVRRGMRVTRDNGRTAKARLVRYAVKVPSEANSGA
jgi:hypothetical protein